MNPQISILIPVQNSRDHVGNCIESILVQNFRDFEIDLVIDGFEIPDVATDRRIRVFNQSRSVGRAGTINEGIRIARGKYLLIVDAEDALQQNALDRLIQTAENSQADVVHSTKFYDVAEEKFSIHQNITARILGDDESLSHTSDLGKQNFYYDFLNFCRVDFLRERRIFEPNLESGAEIFFLAALILNTDRFVNLDVPFYFRRRVQSQKKNSIKSFYRDLPTILDYLRDLFDRSKISRDIQIEITTRLLKRYFFELTQGKIAINSILKHSKDFSAQPTFYSQDFMKIFLRNFCKLITQI